eukprot:1146419-Pelagomonas_calceolata.AAC.4
MLLILPMLQKPSVDEKLRPSKKLFLVLATPAFLNRCTNGCPLPSPLEASGLKVVLCCTHVYAEHFTSNRRIVEAH